MADDDELHRPLHWRREELQALGLLVAVLAVLVLATVAFGFAGLITVMLTLVATAFALLVWISFG